MIAMSEFVPEFVSEFIADLNPTSFSLQPVEGGLSNHNYRLDVQQNGRSSSYFVRQFAMTYNQLDNNITDECAAQQQAANIGLAPNIIGQYEFGIICDWVTGKTWQQAQQVQDDNIEKLALLAAKLHQQPVPAHQLNMAKRLQHYYQTLKAEFKTVQLQQQLKLVIDLIEHQLAPNRHGFCHHDMNPMNFIEDEQSKLYLLDWEFAAAGHCDFDIATLFQTFAWDLSQQTMFLNYYNHFYPAAKVNFAQLQVMAVVVEMMTLLWCIVMYQQDKDDIYLTLWQQSESAIAEQINKLTN